MADEKNISMVRSIRATEDVFEKLKKIAAQGKMSNQGEALTSLIHLWEIDQAKAMIPNRKTEIENFRLTLQKLEDFFLNALEINLSAEARIRQEFEGKLENQTVSISALKKAKEEAEQNIHHFHTVIERLQEEKTKYEIRCNQVEKEKTAVIESYEEKLLDKDRLNKSLQEQVSMNKANIEELKGKLKKEEEQEKVIEQLRSQCNEIQSKAETLAKDFQIKELKAEKELLKIRKEAQDRIDEMQNRYLRCINMLEKKRT